MHDLLILNGTVVTQSGTAELDIAASGETISAIGPRGSLGTEAKKAIDADGCLVIPGGIDPHVHYAMNFENIILTEGPPFSFAAALGGNTTVVDFAFQEPPVGLMDAIANRKQEFAGNMAIDYSVHAILTKDFSYDVVEEIGDAIRSGVPTIKTMMTYGYMTDDGQRWGAMNAVAENGGMSVVHAEDDAIAQWLTNKYIREGKTHGAYICEVRGPIVEEAAIRRAMFLAEKTGSPLYILHMAAGSGVNALAEARGKGLPFYGETLSAYLSFTQDDIWDETAIEVNGKVYNARGCLYNNYPTPKFKEDREVCWQAIADGRLQAVATDHALVSLTDRFETMGTTIENMQAGQAAVELRIPLLYSEGVNSGKISASRWVELISTNPAKITGLWPRKGQLVEGADADVVVFDPRKRWAVRWQDLHMSTQYNCWDGWDLTGKVRDTVLRGAVIVENETWVGDKGRGQFIPRTLLPEVVNGDFSFTEEALGAAVAV